MDAPHRIVRRVDDDVWRVEALDGDDDDRVDFPTREEALAFCAEIGAVPEVDDAPGAVVRAGDGDADIATDTVRDPSPE